MLNFIIGAIIGAAVMRVIDVQIVKKEIEKINKFLIGLNK